MNAVTTMMNQARANGAAFWAARTEQERRFLGVGGAVLGVLLVYGLLIAPALSGRERLQKDLPVLRQQAAELQALALQAGALKAQPNVTPPAMTGDSIKASLAAYGLSAQLIGVSFPGLVDWLDALRRDGRINVQDASIIAQNTAGLVDATLTLHQG